MVDIVRAIRKVVPPSFCVGIQLNSVDHQQTAVSDDTLEQISVITKEKVDFLEISGGTYENPKVPSRLKHAFH